MNRLLFGLLLISSLQVFSQESPSYVFDSLYQRMRAAGVPISDARNLASKAENVFRTEYDTLGWLGPLHVLLLDQERGGNHQEIFRTVKRAIELNLSAGDTIAAAHYLGHFFQGRQWEMPPAETTRLFELLWLVLDYYEAHPEVSYAGHKHKSFLLYHLAFLYNEWQETDEAMRLVDDAIAESLAIHDRGEVAYLKGIKLLLAVYSGQLDSLDTWVPEYERNVEPEDLTEARVLLPEVARGIHYFYNKGQADKAINLLSRATSQSFSKEVYRPYRALLLTCLGNVLVEQMQKEPNSFYLYEDNMMALGYNSLDELLSEAQKELKKSSLDASLLFLNYLYPTLIKRFEQTDQKDSVIWYQKQVIDLKNKSLSGDRMNLLKTLKARYEMRDQQQTIAVLNAEQKASATRERLGLLAVVLIVLLLIGLIQRNRYVRKTGRQLEKQNEQILIEKQRAEKSEIAKQQFLANMSHEIRTPMNAIKGMTEILLRRTPAENQLTYLKAIQESSRSLLVIINDILDLSKLEAAKVELEAIPFSLQELLHNVKTIIQLRADEKGLELQMDWDERSPAWVKGDPTRLHQILLNLLSNAVKFTEKGYVRVTLSSTPAENAGTHLYEIVVIDTGKGIDPTKLESIFEAFKQEDAATNRQFGGTGLGLSISRQLTEAHGGTIRAESILGQGSRFIVQIPYLVHDLPIEADDVASSQATDLGKLKDCRVLLVEDNAFNQMVATEELQDALEGVSITIANNGQEAVEKYQTGAFDMILMDVQMPLMNGYDASRNIRKIDQEVPIIAMTASAFQEEISRCLEAGMNDFVPKPFETDELLAKMAALIV